MPFGLGVWELLVLFLVLMVLFGAKRLPEMGRALGSGLREFKEGVTRVPEEIKRELEDSSVQQPSARVSEHPQERRSHTK